MHTLLTRTKIKQSIIAQKIVTKKGMIMCGMCLNCGEHCLDCNCKGISMKRERIEDLGILSARLNNLLVEKYEFSEMLTSKHDLDDFIETYHSAEKLENLHMQLRNLWDELWEMYSIAYGEEE